MVDHATQNHCLKGDIDPIGPTGQFEVKKIFNAKDRYPIQVEVYLFLEVRENSYFSKGWPSIRGELD